MTKWGVAVTVGVGCPSLPVVRLSGFPLATGRRMHIDSRRVLLEEGSAAGCGQVEALAGLFFARWSPCTRKRGDLGHQRRDVGQPMEKRAAGDWRIGAGRGVSFGDTTLP